MRQTILGALAGAVLVYLFVAGGSDSGRAWAQRTPVSPDNAAGLIALPGVLPDGRQTLTVVDPRNQVIAYYQIEPNRGEIVPKSIRNIHWDLQIDEYNGTSPLPSEVRSLLDQK